MTKAVLLFVLPLLATAAVAQAPPPDSGAGMNPLLDPFAANVRPAMPLPPPPKASALAFGPAPLPPAALPAPALPAGLRVLLIRDSGIGLLGTADAESPSIPVVNARPVRIGEQDYMAEVTSSEIRLFTNGRGKLVWHGTLGGPATVSVPVDLSQTKYIPPLSAGVNPGLRSGTALGASTDTMIRKNGAQ
jgi:hypothetical protein